MKASAQVPARAAAALAYYWARDLVKHPIDSKSRAGGRGKWASEKDLKVADEALQHIFAGQPAYPSHFCGKDINWATNPYPDNEWIWHLNKMTFWEAMGLAYWHTGNEKYAQEWCLQLTDWVRKNPRASHHKYAWRSIEAGIRGHRWTGSFSAFLIHLPSPRQFWWLTSTAATITRRI